MHTSGPDCSSLLAAIGAMADRVAGLSGSDRRRARALALRRLALLDGVFDPLALREIVKAHVGDDRMMEEDVFSVVRLDEAETFVLHQFFNLARWHTQALLTRIREIQLRRTACTRRPIRHVPTAWNGAILHNSLVGDRSLGKKTKLFGGCAYTQWY